MCLKTVFEREVYISLFLSQMVLVSMVNAAEPKAEVIQVGYEDILTRVQIIGQLRCPLMEVVTVRGKWSNDKWPTPKETVFVVTQVNGRALNPPAQFLEIEPVEKASADLNRKTPGEEWELRGVESGGIVGISPEVLRQLRQTDAKATRPSGMGGVAIDRPPRPPGFTTRFCYANARRVQPSGPTKGKVPSDANLSADPHEKPDRQSTKKTDKRSEKPSSELDNKNPF